MEQLETFLGFVVPRINPQTQKGWCKVIQRGNECGSECCRGDGCIFDFFRPDTREPFNEWMETRKNGR